MGRYVWHLSLAEYCSNPKPQKDVLLPPDVQVDPFLRYLSAEIHDHRVKRDLRIYPLKPSCRHSAPLAKSLIKRPSPICPQMLLIPSSDHLTYYITLCISYETLVLMSKDQQAVLSF